MLIRSLVLAITLISSTYATNIKVALAANVGYAIDDLKKEFHKLYPNHKIKITLSGSGKLFAQIKHGASYDIFLSANMQYPKRLYKDGIAISKPTVYAQGGLALFSVNRLDLSQGIKILKSNTIRKIALANPKTAPYGKAAMEVIKNSGYYKKLKSKFIYGESISQTLIYTLQAADIGIVAKSALFSSRMKKYKQQKDWIEVDSRLYTPIDQGMVILKNGENNRGVKDFYNFILSKKGKTILQRFGYIVK